MPGFVSRMETRATMVSVSVCGSVHVAAGAFVVTGLAARPDDQGHPRAAADFVIILCVDQRGRYDGL